MALGKLAAIDIGIVIAYLLGMMWFGIRVGRFIKDDRDYFLGGRRLPWWAIGMSMVVSDIGALDIVGVAGAAYIYGIAMANFEWIGCIPAMIVGAFIFIPFYWRTGRIHHPGILREKIQPVRTDRGGAHIRHIHVVHAWHIPVHRGENDQYPHRMARVYIDPHCGGSRRDIYPVRRIGGGRVHRCPPVRDHVHGQCAHIRYRTGENRRVERTNSSPQ